MDFLACQRFVLLFNNNKREIKVRHFSTKSYKFFVILTKNSKEKPFFGLAKNRKLYKGFLGILLQV